MLFVPTEGPVLTLQLIFIYIYIYIYMDLRDFLAVNRTVSGSHKHQLPTDSTVRPAAGLDSDSARPSQPSGSEQLPSVSRSVAPFPERPAPLPFLLQRQAKAHYKVQVPIQLPPPRSLPQQSASRSAAQTLAAGTIASKSAMQPPDKPAAPTRVRVTCGSVEGELDLNVPCVLHQGDLLHRSTFACV